jgi:hypothetical protein
MGRHYATTPAPPKRGNEAPLTNRLARSVLRPTRYHKISHNPVAIRKLFVDLFLEAYKRAPHQITIDLDATDDPVTGGAFLSWILRLLLLSVALYLL